MNTLEIFQLLYKNQDNSIPHFLTNKYSMKSLNR